MSSITIYEIVIYTHSPPVPSIWVASCGMHHMSVMSVILYFISPWAKTLFPHH